MIEVLKIVLAPFSLLYWVVTSIRNKLYDSNIKRSLSFSLPIINVGNLSMGGTGKTPHIEYLIRLLKQTNNIATLSRGYGRKVYGFQIANSNSTAKSIGDEPFQFYRKFGAEISVAVDVDRVNGVSEICLQQENIELVLLDDAFQHRQIKPGLNILITDFNKPFYNNYILPVGTLRESKTGKNRADIIIISKCPLTISKTEQDIILKKINPAKHQSIFFSSIKYGKFHSLTKFNTYKFNCNPIILVTGIARPKPLIEHLKKKHLILKHFAFPDHYRFKEKDINDIHNLLTKFAKQKPVIITTEKDAMRLLDAKLFEIIAENPWFFQEIEIEINNANGFNTLIEKYVQENSRSY